MQMVDVTDATFQQAVIERSAIVPVVVDLWAEWCGPCKQLGPILEKVIAETQGKVDLAKVDVDANPQIAQAFKVQSIPAVFALVNGQPVDQFMGALPESEVAAFVNKLIPAEEETELSRLLSAGDESSLRVALELEPGNAEVIVALAELLVTEQQPQEALALLEKIPESP
ncbi:MAG: thioredoxin, partial [Actinobacteria bacterium]|nr:thioredoxin [Actinomycetota bacterium]